MTNSVGGVTHSHDVAKTDAPTPSSVKTTKEGSFDGGAGSDGATTKPTTPSAKDTTKTSSGDIIKTQGVAKPTGVTTKKGSFDGGDGTDGMTIKYGGEAVE